MRLVRHGTAKDPLIYESSRPSSGHSFSRYCMHILYDTAIIADMLGVYGCSRITLQSKLQRTYVEDTG